MANLKTDPDDTLPPLPATPGGRYRHYKGGEYEVVGAARHSETLEPLVVYRPLYNATGLWVRPHGMFYETVQVDGQLQPRFAPLQAPPKQAAETASAVHIVPIELAHVPGFHQCLDTVAREARYLAQIQAPPLDQVQKFVGESVAANAAQFVALDGDEVVGWADIFPHWAHALAHCGTLGMGVLPSHRGQGIGKRLLQACIAKVQTQGITRVSLEARADNHPAIALYESVGFQHECVKRQALRFEGVYFDAVQMALLLPESAN